MIFRPELVEKILAGEKTETRRLVSDNPRSPWWVGSERLTPGRVFAICPGRGKRAVARARIVSTIQEPLNFLTDISARAEGFKDRVAFLDYWRELHGKLDLSVWVWVVRFSLVETT